MAGKILSIALAAAYLTSGVCRFACAMTMEDARPAAASEIHHGESGDCCHHHESKSADKGHQQPRPCCVAQGEGVVALIPSHPGIRAPIVRVELFLAVPKLLAAPSPRAIVLANGPPLADSQVLTSSSASPRAPPSLPVVL